MPDPTPSYTEDNGSGQSLVYGNWLRNTGTGWTSDGTETSSEASTSPASTGSGSSSVQTDKLVVKYYANGATGDPPSETVKVYSGKKQSVTLEATVKENETGMTKGTGYYFLGWSRSTTDGPVTHYPGDVVTKTWSRGSSGQETYSMYAVFKNTRLYVYMPDEHTKEQYYRWSSKKSGTQTSLKGAIFHRKGYTQVGWATTEGGAKVYDLEQTLTPNSDTVEILYPVWQVNTYTVTLHPNGVEAEDVEISIDYDADITIPTDTFTRTGYTIGVWNEDPDSFGLAWIPGREYTYLRDEDIDLYAIWEGNEYNVYYRNEGSNENIHQSKAIYGSPFYTDRLPTPDGRKFNTFEGWVADDTTVLTKADAWYDSYSYTDNPNWSLLRDLVITSRWNSYYPFGKIFFGGKYSDDIGVKVEEPPSYQWPEKQNDHKKIIGRNGDIITSQRRYENVEKKYKISAYDGVDYYSVAKKVSAWLHPIDSEDYVRLEDSYEPDIFMLAAYEESNSLENILATAGKCEITFNCKPQKFLVSGDREIAITQSGQVINNPTNNNALPIISFYGAGTITINGVELIVHKNFNKIIFNAESVNALDVSGYNMNYFIYSMDPIVLKPGNNVITFDGDISRLTITPRWWRV